MKRWTTTEEKSSRIQVPPRCPSMWWGSSPCSFITFSHSSARAFTWVVEVAVQMTK